MALRNFWLEASIGGRKTMVEGGPQSKDGGFVLRVFQRDNGRSVQVAWMHGFVNEAGELELATDIRATTYQAVGENVETWHRTRR